MFDVEYSHSGINMKIFVLHCLKLSIVILVYKDVWPALFDVEYSYPGI